MAKLRTLKPKKRTLDTRIGTHICDHFKCGEVAVKDSNFCKKHLPKICIECRAADNDSGCYRCKHRPAGEKPFIN